MNPNPPPPTLPPSHHPVSADALRQHGAGAFVGLKHRHKRANDGWTDWPSYLPAEIREPTEGHLADFDFCAEWSPIALAPRDGSWVDVGYQDGAGNIIRAQSVRWYNENWRDSDDWIRCPTHFRPLSTEEREGGQTRGAGKHECPECGTKTDFSGVCNGCGKYNLFRRPLSTQTQEGGEPCSPYAQSAADTTKSVVPAKAGSNAPANVRTGGEAQSVYRCGNCGHMFTKKGNEEERSCPRCGTLSVRLTDTVALPTPPASKTPEEEITGHLMDRIAALSAECTQLRQERDEARQMQSDEVKRADALADRLGEKINRLTSDLSQAREELAEEKRKLNTILYDVNYKGGLQDWQQRFHEALTASVDAAALAMKTGEENTSLRAQLSTAQATIARLTGEKEKHQQ